MSIQTIQFLVFLALLVHGIGHFQGVVSSTGVKFRKTSTNISWLLKGIGEKWNKILCLIFYLVAGVFGILAALSFKNVLFPVSEWMSLALVAAIFSSAALILFPKALAMFFNKAGAIAVNLIIYYSILFQGGWPAVIFEN